MKKAATAVSSAATFMKAMNCRKTLFAHGASTARKILRRFKRMKNRKMRPAGRIFCGILPVERVAVSNF
jgi:hypothetical protein